MAAFLLNILVEAVFMALLAPIVALSHTIFLTRLFVFRSAGTWTNQLRESHAVPWALAFRKLWPQMLAGCVILGVVYSKAPRDLGFALLGSTGLIFAIVFAVLTASPLVGTLFARIGIGRIPEEDDPPAVLLPLNLPAFEASAAFGANGAPAPECLNSSERYEELSDRCAFITATGSMARRWIGCTANSCARAIWFSTSARM